MKPKIGLQLYTIREQMQQDFVGGLTAVARVGYPGVQLAGYGGMTAGQLRSTLKGLNLEAAGSHVGLGALQANADAAINYCLEVGTPDVIIPAIPQAMRESKEGFREVADFMNSVGARCKELGARLHYHNHAFEYAKFDGEYAMDLLLGWCDPSLVFWEPDVYWIKFAGVDPSLEIRKHSGRTPFIHIKDMTAGAKPTYAEVGEGIIDFQPIFAASEASGAEWYIVEQDQCARPPLESIALSLGHLKEWGKV